MVYVVRKGKIKECKTLIDPREKRKPGLNSGLSYVMKSSQSLADIEVPAYRQAVLSSYYVEVNIVRKWLAVIVSTMPQVVIFSIAVYKCSPSVEDREFNFSQQFYILEFKIVVLVVHVRGNQGGDFYIAYSDEQFVLRWNADSVCNCPYESVLAPGELGDCCFGFFRVSNYSCA